LQQPVKVWVFDPQQSSQDRELLEEYRRQSKQFSYEFVNPNAQPSLVERLEVKKAGDAIVEAPSTNRKQFIQTVNDQDRLSESKVTNAIVQVTNTQQAHVYFIQGHGEHPIEESQGAISQAAKALQDKGFTVKPLNLVETSAFPKDANVIVLAGPQKALLKPETDALENYVKQGGNLFVMVDPNTNPGLDGLLSSWGVTLDPRVVIDTSGRVVNLGPADVTVTQYGDHPITKDFGNSLSFYSAARPVDAKKTPGIQFTPLLFTSDRVWAESDLKKQPVQFDPQTDRKGPVVLGFALTQTIEESPKPSPSPSPTASPNSKASPSPSPRVIPNSKASSSPSPAASPNSKASPSPSPSASPSTQASPTPSPTPTNTANSGAKKKESRMVVIGNSSFAVDGYFGQVINGDVFLNSVRWLSQEEQQTLSIRPKETKNRRITLNAQQANLVGWLALVILPLIGFGTAATVWWRRR
jgi:ABC-type uncharacterized transport system involved in gliding motility auxiliary subunit